MIEGLRNGEPDRVVEYLEERGSVIAFNRDVVVLWEYDRDVDCYVRFTYYSPGAAEAVDVQESLTLGDVRSFVMDNRDSYCFDEPSARPAGEHNAFMRRVLEILREEGS